MSWVSVSFFSAFATRGETWVVSMHRVRLPALASRSDGESGMLIRSMFSRLPWKSVREEKPRPVADVVVLPVATMDAHDGLGDLSCPCSV